MKLWFCLLTHTERGRSLSLPTDSEKCTEATGGSCTLKKKSTHLIQILFQVWFRHYDKLNQNHSSGFCRLTAPERPPNVFGLERCDHCMELKPSYIHRTKRSIKIRELTRTSVKVQRTERELATNQGLSEFSEISQRQLTSHNNHAHHNKVHTGSFTVTVNVCFVLFFFNLALIA